MKIKKTYGTAILTGNVVDGLEDNSSTNAPSQRAVNEALNGFVLYENSSGEQGNVTLSDIVGNYRYIDVIYNGGTARWYTDSPSRYITLFNYGKDGTVMIWCAKSYSAKNNILTKVSVGRTYTYSTTSNDENDTFYIYKVVGYK